MHSILLKKDSVALHCHITRRHSDTYLRVDATPRVYYLDLIYRPNLLRLRFHTHIQYLDNMLFPSYHVVKQTQFYVTRMRLFQVVYISMIIVMPRRIKSII
ncbi:hypothetical protein [Emiliania huxleyi virus 99B1]|nr:hypothetical protein [Emiliania huxleyi virus 99B1]